MPLIQGGPPQWIWERTPDSLKWEVLQTQSPEGHAVYELRLNCGLEIVRCQFFSRDELRELHDTLHREVMNHEGGSAENIHPAAAPSTHRETSSAAGPETSPRAHPGNRPEGIVSDPDFLAAR